MGALFKRLYSVVHVLLAWLLSTTQLTLPFQAYYNLFCITKNDFEHQLKNMQYRGKLHLFLIFEP